ncbi:MAG: tetratricopeptide repeat protein [Myxococcales bacterium]|nr:tetratricopeptide repeat protein [Myxococcales bacterium]
MDQLMAHLDRGWDLAQRGDTHGASESARRAVALAPDSAEAHNLLGYVASLDGDCDEAVEAYQQAILLDDTYVEAMLNAAELLLHPFGDFDEAVRMCDRVLDISDFDDEILEALLLKFEAHWAKGDEADARAVLKRLPLGPFERSGHNFLVGRANYEAGEFAKAEPLLIAAVASDPSHAEAHYYQGLLAERHGRFHDATCAFLRVRQLELGAEMPSWAPDEASFMALTMRAIDELPAELRELARTAELYVVDLPGAEVIVDGVDVHAPAYAEATHAPRARDAASANPERKPDGALNTDAPRGTADGKTTSGSGKVPAEETDAGASRVEWRIFLYVLNILRASPNLPAVEDQIRSALEQELTMALNDLRPRSEPDDG